jgi:trans-aconitate methyltransferase
MTTIDTTRALWDESATAYDQHTRRFGTHDRITATLILLAPRDPATILDFGCGPGNSTRLLRRAFPTATIHGVDSSAAMLDIARRATGPGVSYHHTDLTTDEPPEPLTPRSVSLVVCANSLFHVGDKHALLGRLTPLLAPDATILLSAPENVFQPADRLAWPLRAEPHDTLMDLLLESLRRRGHQVHTRQEDREILTEERLSDLFAAFGLTVQCGAVLRLRRTPAERLSSFAVPATAAEVFPAVPPADVQAAADELAATATGLPAQERCECRECHPCWSSRVFVFVEDAAESFVSAYAELCQGRRFGDRGGQES